MAKLDLPATTSLTGWTLDQTAGTVTVGSITGLPDHLLFTLDNVDHGSNFFCSAKATIADATELLIRVVVQWDADYSFTGDHKLLILWDGATRVADISLNVSSGLIGTFYIDDGGSFDTIWSGLHGLNDGAAITRELWLVWKASSGPGNNDGYQGLGGAIDGGRFGIRTGMDTDTLAVDTIEVGMCRSQNAVDGSVRILSLEAWDSRATDIAHINYAASQGKGYVGCPTVVDVTGNASQSVSKVEIRNNAGGPWQNITLASATGTRSDAKADDCRLVDTTRFASGNYDGCLVEPTAAPGVLMPASQVFFHDLDNTRAILTGNPAWLHTEADAYSANANAPVPITFDIWRVKEISSGTYRVGVPASAITRAGVYQVRLTLADASTPTQTVRVEALEHRPLRYTVANDSLAIWLDDNTPEQAGLASLFASRSYKPALGVIAGTVGVRFNGWGVLRMLVDAGWTIASHLFDATNLSGYADDAETMQYVEWARRMIAVQTGVKHLHFVAPQGVTVGPSGRSLIAAIEQTHTAVRTSGGNYRTAIPLANAINSVSVYNNTSAEATDALKAADIFDTAQAEGAGLYSFQFHRVGSTAATETTLSLITAILDEAESRELSVLDLQTLGVATTSPALINRPKGVQRNLTSRLTY